MMRLCFLMLFGLLTAVSAQNFGQLDKVLLSETHCLDGSPAGYYYGPALAYQDRRNWAIFFEGGGDCATLESCEERTQTMLGSSINWPASGIDNYNVLSADPEVNPGFATWNHVFIPYCTGDIHSGQRDTLDPFYNLFYFSGNLNFLAILKDLSDHHDFNRSEKILVSGASAGGIAANIYADVVAAYNPRAYVRGYPQGGWFFPNVSVYAAWQVGAFVPPVVPAVQELWDSYLPPACIASPDVVNKADCGTVDTYFKYLTTPLYISENQFDSNQIFTQLGCPENATDTDAFIAYFGQQMRLSIRQVIQSRRGDGLFLMSCLDHIYNTNISSPTTIYGFEQGPSVVDWFFGRHRYPHILVDHCPHGDLLPCNPTC